MANVIDPKPAANAGAFPPFQTRRFETAQLTLRAFDEADIEPLYEIMRDADAMRYTYQAPSREHCVERLLAYAAEADSLGYAPWTVLDRTDGRVVGWGGLNIDPFDPGWGIEVAYCFHPHYWGRGFGTELVRASLEVGFAQLALPTIVAFVHRDNVGSARVLMKNGFQFTGYVAELDRNHYVIQQHEWQKIEE